MTISSGSCLWRNAGAKNPFRAYCIDSKAKYQTIYGKGEFVGLLLLAGICGRNLKSLQVGLLHWSTFASPEDAVLPGLFPSLEHRTRLNLVIGIGTDNVGGNPIEVCYMLLSRGGLALFIKQLPTLEELIIALDFYDCEQGIFGASSEMVLHPDGYWPHLYKLDLSSISIDAGCMATFFEKHRETLKDLCLSGFRLSESDTLYEFFSVIRDKLTLRDLEVFGPIWATNDEESDVEDTWDTGNRGQKNKHRKAIKRFVIDKGPYILLYHSDIESSSEDEESVPDIDDDDDGNSGR